MKDRAILLGDFRAELGNQLLQHLDALRGIHRKAEDGLEEGGVPGHVQLGDHADMPRLGISDDVADLVERVRVLRVTPRLPSLGGGDLREDFGFHAPSRIVRQMPVEGVELVAREEIQLMFEAFDALEVAACVVHETADGVTGRILNLRTRKRRSLRGGELGQRLARIENARRAAARHANGLRGDAEAVTFRRQRGIRRHHRFRHGAFPACETQGCGHRDRRERPTLGCQKQGNGQQRKSKGKTFHGTIVSYLRQIE